MSWPTIDITTPAGNSAKKLGDDYIRELKTQLIQALQVISGYPSIEAGRDAVWTTATRPTTGLVAGIAGFNSTLGYREYWTGTAWAPSNPLQSHTHAGSDISSAVANSTNAATAATATNALSLGGYLADKYPLLSSIVASVAGDAGEIEIPTSLSNVKIRIKWGSSLIGSNPLTVYFPTAFPTLCQVVIPVLSYRDPDANIYLLSKGPASVTFQINGTLGNYVYWIAIGC